MLRLSTLALLACSVPAFAQEINVYSHRQPELIQPLVDAFTLVNREFDLRRLPDGNPLRFSALRGLTPGAETPKSGQRGNVLPLPKG